MKRLGALLLLLLTVLSFASCGIFKIEIPDLSGVSESLAEKTILEKGLLPVIEYEYSDSVKEGFVVETDPKNGEKVSKDTKVTIYISKGPDYIMASNARITWKHIDPQNPDEWEFYAPEIYEGTLYLSCDIIFGTSFILETANGIAYLGGKYGDANILKVLDDNFVNFSNDYTVTAGETITFILAIPLDEYLPKKPTNVDCEIFGLIDGERQSIEVGFEIFW